MLPILLFTLAGGWRMLRRAGLAKV
jgi:hypothetical protein